MNTSKNIESWVHEYADVLYNWALYKTSNRELAEDLVQDTFLAALRSIDGFRGDSNPKSWLLKILNNKIVDHYRETAKQAVDLRSEISKDAFKTTESFFDEGGNWTKKGITEYWNNDEEHLLDNATFLAILEACMDDLPENWREAVTFKYLTEKPATEICQELGISPSNYWQVIHRAKLLLRKCLDLHYFNPQRI